MARPQSLAGLSILLVAGDRLTAGLSASCEATSLRPGEWRECLVAGRRARLLLVEGGSGVDGIWGDELDALVDACRDREIEPLLWVTESPASRYWLERCAAFERVFATDRGQLDALRAAGGAKPACLWPAAPLPLLPPQAAGGDGRAGVVWLGGWNSAWPRQWRERLAAILRGAAPFGLAIHPEADLRGLPAELAGHVSDATAVAANRRALLRAAPVAIAADPQVCSPTFAPPVAFEAVAAGTAVVTPHDFATPHDFGTGRIRGSSGTNLLPLVADAPSATAAIDRLCNDPELHRETMDHLQRIVLNNHTYSHRLATLASVLGHRLVPDALDSAPA